MATTDPSLLTAPASVGPAAEVIEGRSPWELFWLRFRSDKAALVGLGFIVFLSLIALFAPLIARYVAHHGVNDLHTGALNQFGLPSGPSRHYWFGMDTVGRDVFVRVLYGARTALIVGILATAFALVLGITLGMVAGYFGGVVDAIISRLIDVVLSLPLLLFAIGIAAACSTSIQGCLGGIAKPGLSLVIFIITLFSWTYVARIMRGQTLALREREFIEASRSLGAGNIRIIFREVLPNLMAPILIYGTLLIPANILFESYLSFLGLGIPQSTASWGQLMSAATDHQAEWWFMLFPGLFLLITTLGFNLLGDGLRDALDPRTSLT